MSSASASAARRWAVAASIATVEALKDQLGFCRWNYALRNIHQHVKSSVSKSYTEAAAKLSASSGLPSDVVKAQRRVRRPEEAHRRVMELGCWGPESARF